MMSPHHCFCAIFTVVLDSSILAPSYVGKYISTNSSQVWMNVEELKDISQLQ